MAVLVPITVTEGNDETIRATIDRLYLADDLVTVEVVEFYLKDDGCEDDTGALLLSSTDAAEVVIISRTSAQVVADVFLPALHGSYPRVYRVDGVTSAGRRRTGPYGPVTVNNV